MFVEWETVANAVRHMYIQSICLINALVGGKKDPGLRLLPTIF